MAVSNRHGPSSTLKRPAAATAPPSAPPPKKLAKKPAGHAPLVYASDCSGLDGGAFALHHMGREFTRLWGGELDDNCRAVFKANHLDGHLIEVDLTERNFKQFNKQLYDKVDVYTAGCPCQLVSMAGNKEGTADGQGRGWWAIA